MRHLFHYYWVPIRRGVTPAAFSTQKRVIGIIHVDCGGGNPVVQSFMQDPCLFEQESNFPKKYSPKNLIHERSVKLMIE